MARGTLKEGGGHLKLESGALKVPLYLGRTALPTAAAPTLKNCSARGPCRLLALFWPSSRQ